MTTITATKTKTRRTARRPRPTVWTLDLSNMANCGSQQAGAARAIAAKLGAASDIDHIRNASAKAIYVHRVTFAADADTIATIQLLLPAFIGAALDAADKAAAELRSELTAQGIKGARLERHCAHLRRCTIAQAGAELADAL
ncbi:hypothetical protein ACH4TC_18545 [Streptomyces spororaveus]|uniref:hypothetical protein n=1 Tax=Streptomyces spororaveus TaxID=284039 RepID=UPI00379DBB9A